MAPKQGGQRTVAAQTQVLPRVPVAVIKHLKEAT